MTFGVKSKIRKSKNRLHGDSNQPSLPYHFRPNALPTELSGLLKFEANRCVYMLALPCMVLYVV